MENQNILLSVRNITKIYPGVVALDNVSFDIKEGEMHALIGENGAGKSTLIKVLAGATHSDEGKIIFKGTTYDKMTPNIAASLGISVIYQEFNLMNSLTVAENVFMGHYPMEHGLVNRKEMNRRTEEIFASMGVSLDPKAVVADLSVAHMQLVEIAKSLSKDLSLLIMDEPTAPLTNKEVDELFRIVRGLRDRGVSIIFISHRLDEIFDLCDRVTVLRDGKYVSTDKVKDITKDDLVLKMVGREVSNVFPARNIVPGEVVLKVDNLSGNGVEDISFELRRGEIIGFGGLVGAGRTEIMRVLFGADPKEAGTVTIKGRQVEIKSPMDAVSNGMVLLPEDRKTQGLLLNLPISQNIILPCLDKIKSGIVLNRSKEKEIVDKQVSALRVACYSSSQIAGTLSGGNQQKVVVGKWLAADADVLIFDEPTRGIDVGAKYEIYLLLNQLCEEGKAIIMISSEMSELLGMSDRIIVMYEGKQMTTLTKEAFSQEAVLSYASGEKEGR
ncbi:MAG: sugar ABC transporter ATP-binding protein [Oscillospiraceae bacterium]|nr:sugar ABC transporter ATP-binding protein [Oscillospiraceae bacterium]